MVKKQQIEHILTPETEELFFRDQILPPLLRGENVVLVRVPHSGTKRNIMFLIENSAFFGYQELGKYQIVYINPYDLPNNSPESYLRLMSYNLKDYPQDETKSAFFALKEQVEKLAKESFSIIFVLADFNKFDYAKAFFNNLYSLYQIEKTKIHFIFVITENIFSEEKMEKYDQLTELITENIIYMPILSLKDTLFTVNRLISKYGYQVPLVLKNAIPEIIGGHPALIRSCLRILNEKQNIKTEELLDFLEQQWEVKTFLDDIWKSITDEERAFLWHAAKQDRPELKVIPSFIRNLGLVHFEKGKLCLFSLLFESFIKKQKIKKTTLSICSQTGELLADGIAPREKITLSEHRLLTVFLKNPNKVISRDRLAEAIWEKDSFEKYSDWAMDQSISLLRKKLDSLGVSPNSIQTIKGWGYRWID
ncbi:MAG TPA: winged helix-turn-helix domain-containing protein [Patescibacteria group bacterium]|nr:winged helix-turn-helix domain-containing protein [Patescibacteria group bacterium]